MSEPISPATFDVLERYHRRVQNQILKLKEQEDWKCYCTEHKIPVKGADQALTRKKATIRRTVPPQKKTPTRVCRKAAVTSPVYTVKSLTEQLRVYYHQLEKLSVDSSVSSVNKGVTRCPGSNVDHMAVTVVDVGTSPIDDVSQEPEGRDVISDKTFRVMLNPEPNERFCVVKKERVFRSPDTNRWQVHPAESRHDQINVGSQPEALECKASGKKPELTGIFRDNATQFDDEAPESKPPISLDVPDRLQADIELYKKKIGCRMKWKQAFLKLEEIDAPWTFIESASNDILGSAVESVLLELEEIFGCVVDELLEQEFREPMT
ncbi:unnamed protein product [Ixodes hexagonus]